MVRRLTRQVAALAVAALCSAPVSAAVAPSFEQTLQLGRAEALAVRAAQVQAKSASDLSAAERDVRALTQDAWTLRFSLDDVRSRARRHATRAPGAPDDDPFLVNAVQQLDFNMRRFAQDASLVERELRQAADRAVKDPSLVEAARSLVRHASDVRDEAQWLANGSRDGAWELRSAGFSIEAFSIQNSGSAAYDSAREISLSARDLLERVSQ
jgi:hypothetical protein